jgi:hypothetical protein
MRVLIINSNRYRDPLPVMPIGACAVASALIAAGHPTRILDLCFGRNPGRRIAAAVADFNPGCVGVSIRNLDTCNGVNPRFLIDAVHREVIAPLKAAFAGPIVLGGAATGINAAELLAYFDLEYAVRGDGEEAMVAVVERLERGEQLDTCAGLTIRRQGRIAADNEPCFHDNLDSLPWSRPYRHLELGPYHRQGSPMLIQTKRGCSLSCSYCTYNHIEGRRYRLRDPDKIAAEIGDWVNVTGQRRIEIVDSTFNAPLDHAKTVLRAIIALNLRLNLSTMGLNPRFIDAELLDLLAAAGFHEISLGAESLCDQTLAGLGKNFSVADIEAAAGLLAAGPIPVMWFLLLGAPNETANTARQTLDRCAALMRPGDIANIGIGIRLYNGAPMSQVEAQASADGLLHPVAYHPTAVSIAELKRIATRATLRNPNFLMFDEGANIPMLFRLFFSAVFPTLPIWRGYIFGRWMERFSPAFLVRAVALKLLGKI